MRLYLTGSMLFLTACSTPEYRLITPEVPADLRSEVVVTPRERVTLSDIALILADYKEALDLANSRILAIDEILTNYEERASTKGSGDPATAPCRPKDEMLSSLLSGSYEMTDQTALLIKGFGPVLLEIWRGSSDQFTVTIRDDVQMCVVQSGRNLAGRMLTDLY